MNETHFTLARDWDYSDCTGWFWCEKFDGCRAFWDGSQLWTRGGNIIEAPASFLAKFPVGVQLDGEIYAGRGGYIEAMNAARHGIFTDAVHFVCFDVPQTSGNWIARMKSGLIFANDIVKFPKFGKVAYRDEASELAAEIISGGGEGLMLRSPFVKRYEAKRTKNLMRIKAKNLYAPWHGLKSDTGLDSIGYAFNPEIEWKIRDALCTH